MKTHVQLLQNQSALAYKVMRSSAENCDILIGRDQATQEKVLYCGKGKDRYITSSEIHDSSEIEPTSEIALSQNTR